ncbi:hypothetical protein [Methyloraptor flagellatus]|uniref:DUF4148 domain-containing protein n=1 Tax=Methyloraptor flagellatus TaxID=3162530 RepID=A0AAU7X8B2_9HYPH
MTFVRTTIAVVAFAASATTAFADVATDADRAAFYRALNGAPVAATVIEGRQAATTTRPAGLSEADALRLQVVAGRQNPNH